MGREDGQSNHRILDRYVFIEKKQEKLKAQVRDASYKLKSKLVTILRKERYYNEQRSWEAPDKRVP